jgi:hypothetical protein
MKYRSITPSAAFLGLSGKPESKKTTWETLIWRDNIKNGHTLMERMMSEFISLRI